MSKKRKILQILNLWRLIPAWVAVNLLKSEKKQLVFDEMEYWNECTQIKCTSYFDMFSILLLLFREYRSLLCYRCGGGICYAVKILFPPMETLYINCRDIGPRLFIQHGFASIISAKRIGSDCWINQQVTIGYTFDSEPPVIGNGVRISAGAKVIGCIIIGDNAIVAANATVVKDVPKNAIVGGVPAKIIGENIDHRLYGGKVDDSKQS